MNKWVATAVGMTTLIGILFGIDARYLHQAEAAEAFQQASIERERGDLETQLKLAQLELKSLRGREDDESKDRRDYLKARITVIEQRLIELQAAK